MGRKLRRVPTVEARRPALDFRTCDECGVKLATSFERWVLMHYKQPDGYPEWDPHGDLHFCSWTCLKLYMGGRP